MQRTKENVLVISDNPSESDFFKRHFSVKQHIELYYASGSTKLKSLLGEREYNFCIITPCSGKWVKIARYIKKSRPAADILLVSDNNLSRRAKREGIRSITFREYEKVLASEVPETKINIIPDQIDIPNVKPADDNEFPYGFLGGPNGEPWPDLKNYIWPMDYELFERRKKEYARHLSFLRITRDMHRSLLTRPMISRMALSTPTGFWGSARI